MRHQLSSHTKSDSSLIIVFVSVVGFIAVFAGSMTAVQPVIMAGLLVYIPLLALVWRFRWWNLPIALGLIALFYWEWIPPVYLNLSYFSLGVDEFCWLFLG